LNSEAILGSLVPLDGCTIVKRTRQSPTETSWFRFTQIVCDILYKRFEQVTTAQLQEFHHTLCKEVIELPFSFKLRRSHLCEGVLHCRPGTSDVQTHKETLCRLDYRKLVEDIPKGEAVLVAEVGGNVGDTVAFFGMATEEHKASKIIVYECEASSLTMLERNVVQLTQARSWPQNKICIVGKAIVADCSPSVTLNVNRSVYNRYRSSTFKPTSNDSYKVVVQACNLLQELLRELQGGQYETLVLKVDIEGGELPLLDAAHVWMAELKKQVPTLRRIKMMLEYSLDVDPKISEWLRRYNLCREVFDTVTTRRKFKQEDSSKNHRTWNANNADLWICDWRRKNPNV